MAIDCRFSREVLGESGEYFNPQVIDRAFAESFAIEARTDDLRRRVHDNYQWDAVAESYRRLADGRNADYEPAAGQRESEIPAPIEEKLSVAV